MIGESGEGVVGMQRGGKEFVLNLLSARFELFLFRQNHFQIQANFGLRFDGRKSRKPKLEAYLQ